MFDDHAGGVAANTQSAEVVVPLVMAWLNPLSVLDVGCGTGSWVRAFISAGVPEVRGLDGGPPEDLLFDPALYTQVDLRVGGAVTRRRFDLALCLEVAEHLPDEAGERLVDLLCRVSDRVLFSAAIPGQGGPGHVNEQMQSYWSAQFGGHGLAAYDRLRTEIWADDRVSWWYRQNVLLYARPHLMGT